MDARRNRALEALLNSRTRSEAAKLAGVAESTMRRYLHEDDFRREYESRQGEILDDAVSNAKRTLSQSLETLSNIMDDREVAPSVRMSAARSLFDSKIKLIETQDLIEKIEKFEEWRRERDDAEFD